MKTDNSGFHPIMGDIIDVVYERFMSIIIKPEVTEDEDLLIVRETPGTTTLINFVTVKQEKQSIENTQTEKAVGDVVLEENLGGTQRS